VLGANLIYPRRQRFHDDDPAGKFENGVVVGLLSLFFARPDLFVNVFRLGHSVQRRVLQRRWYLHDLRLFRLVGRTGGLEDAVESGRLMGGRPDMALLMLCLPDGTRAANVRN
jgi:hypothetical protein